MKLLFCVPNAALDAVWSENPVWETYEWREISLGRASSHSYRCIKSDRGSLQVTQISESAGLLITYAALYTFYLSCTITVCSVTGKLKFWRLSTATLKHTTSYSSCRLAVRRLSVQRWLSGRTRFSHTVTAPFNLSKCTCSTIIYFYLSNQTCLKGIKFKLYITVASLNCSPVRYKDPNINVFWPLCFRDHTKSFYVSFRVMLSTAELHWESSGFSTALPVLLQALALARQHHLQSLASETILHLAFTQVSCSIKRDFT